MCGRRHDPSERHTVDRAHQTVPFQQSPAFCAPPGRIEQRPAPVPGPVPIRHDGSVDPLTSAELGLDYGTVRLERTTAAWFVAGSRLGEEVRASLGPLVAGIEQSARPGCLGSSPSQSSTLLRVWPRQTAWSPSPSAWNPLGGSIAGIRATMEDTSSYLRTARGTGSPNLHVVEHDGTQWRRWMRLRDLLCRSPDARERYEVVKSRVADQHATGRKTYTDGKTEVVKELLGRVRMTAIPR
jgi:hypothetical protein